LAVLRLITNSYLFGVLFDGEVNQLGALENSFGVGPCLLIQAPGRRPITHQPTAFGEISDRIDRGHCVAGRKRDKLLTPSDEERVRDHGQRQHLARREPAVSGPLAQLKQEERHGRGNCMRSGKDHRIVGGTR